MLGHSRRGIFEAKDAEPYAAGQALEQIGALYKVEEQIRQLKLTGEASVSAALTGPPPLCSRLSPKSRTRGLPGWLHCASRIGAAH